MVLPSIFSALSTKSPVPFTKAFSSTHHQSEIPKSGRGALVVKLTDFVHLEGSGIGFVPLNSSLKSKFHSPGTLPKGCAFLAVAASTKGALVAVDGVSKTLSILSGLVPAAL